MTRLGGASLAKAFIYCIHMRLSFQKSLYGFDAFYENILYNKLEDIDLVHVKNICRGLA